MNYFPDFMALAEIALVGGVGVIILLLFFALGSKARREYHQRSLKIEAQEIEIALLKTCLDECENDELYLDREIELDNPEGHVYRFSDE